MCNRMGSRISDIAPEPSPIGYRERIKMRISFNLLTLDIVWRRLM
jgi:hypothetical protein